MKIPGRAGDAERQQHVQQAAHEVGPEVAELVVIGTLAAPMLALGAAGLGRRSSSGPRGWQATPRCGGGPRSGISFANVLGGLAMLAGRYVPLLAALAVAGAMAGRPVMATGRGSLRTDNATFVALVLAVIVTVALVTIVPALALGPAVQGLTDRLF